MEHQYSVPSSLKVQTDIAGDVYIINALRIFITETPEIQSWSARKTPFLEAGEWNGSR
jgi:hypothetical protein